MRLTLLTILTLLQITRAATSMKLRKHSTGTAAYISHLTRRGIVPDLPKRKVYPRQPPSKRRPRSRLVRTFHPELAVPPDPRRRDAPEVSSEAASSLSGSGSSSSGSTSITTPASSASLPSSSVLSSGSLSAAAAHGSNSSIPSGSSTKSPSALTSASVSATIWSVLSNSSAVSTRSQFLSASASAPSASSYVVGLNDVAGIAYTIDALIGEEQTPVPVLVDTGSAPFWVAAKQCDRCASSQMTTSIDMGSACPNPAMNLTYGIGSAGGCAIKTTLNIGGLELNDYNLLGVTEIDDGTAGLGWVYSGMWGIASSSMSQLGQTPIDQLYSESKITSSEVGFYFVRDEDAGESQVIIGDVKSFDHSTIPVDISRVAYLSGDPEDQGHYKVPLDTLKAFGNEMWDFKGAKVILDTGTTMLVVPPSLWKPLYGTLGNGTTIELNQPDKPYPVPDKERIYVLPCDMLSPNQTALTFTFGGVDFGMQWRDFIGSELEDEPGFCYPSVISLGDDLILLGGTFLVNVYHSVNSQNGDVAVYGLQ